MSKYAFKKPIVTYDRLIDMFPNIKQKSKDMAADILPLYPSPKLVQILAALITDGHIDWYTSDGRPRTRKIILYSSKKEECKWFLKICKDIFGVDGKIQGYISQTGYSKKISYKAVIYNSIIARILILAGTPAGNKTKISYLIPNWIANGNKEIKKSFLKVLYNFDGCKPYKYWFTTGHHSPVKLVSSL